MQLPIDEITPDTACPSMRNPNTGHYPKSLAGTVITMPGVGGDPFGQDQTVLLPLCGAENTYLDAPHTEQRHTLRLCPKCESMRLQGIRTGAASALRQTTPAIPSG